MLSHRFRLEVNMMLTKRIHPGDVLSEVYLKTFKPAMTLEALAEAVQVPTEEMSQLLEGQSDITIPIARRLATLCRTTPDYWLKLQKAYDRQRRGAFRGLSGRARK